MMGIYLLSECKSTKCDIKFLIVFKQNNESLIGS
uniref:Uncharacterized protein n=1 Tax=Arundo donax TaxID=35708 RepID=A0A0A8ZL17_ARUDO